MTTRARLDVLEDQGLIAWPTRGKLPAFKRYRCSVVASYRGLDYLRQALRLRIEEEGLRPFSARTGVPVGQLRSLAQGRASMSTTLESIAAVLDLECYIGPRRAHRPPPPVPPAIARALDLSAEANVADAVRAIESDPTARKKREVLAVVQALGDSAAAAAALTSDMVSRRPSLSAARERAVAWIRMARPVRPAAGTGSTFDVGSNVWIGVAANALPSRAHPERLICVRAAGSAMEPTICEGDFVAVDPRRKALHDGQPFAVDVGAELLLRRLRRSGRRWLLSRDHQ